MPGSTPTPFITPHVVRREGEPAAASSYKDWIQNLRNELRGGKAATSGAATSGPVDDVAPPR